VNPSIAADIAAIQSISAVPTVLEAVSEITGLRFACVARVTGESWTACAVLDKIGFGLQPGGELDVATTLCNEVRSTNAAIVIDKASDDKQYCNHLTPQMYGFESYISIPLHRANGEYFGTLCALDPIPAKVSDTKIVSTLKLFAELISLQLEAETQLDESQTALLHVRKSAAMQEKRFQLLVSCVTDYAIYMLSPEGYVNSWNAGAQRFKGYTEDEILGQHFSRFYGKEDQAAGIPVRALQIAREKGTFEDEGWRVRKDGSRFWASVVIDPIYDSEDELIGFAKITRDITERKQAEEALHASEEKFRLLVGGVTDYAIYMLSLSGEVTNWNAGAERIKGYASDDVLGTHFSRFYTEEDRASGLPTKALETAIKEGRFESEGWRIRKDGSKFWAHVVIDTIRDEQGKFVGLAKITRDITERRDAAEALERATQGLLQAKTEEYEHLLRLFEQAPGFVCFFRGPDHIYELQNATHHRLAQYKDIIGKPVREALPELEGQGFFELLDNVFATGVPFLGQALPLLVERQPGLPAEVRHIDFVYQPIFGADNKVVGIFSQGSDVTDRVRAEEDSKRKQLELERLIAERTAALEQAEAALAQAHQLQGDKLHLLQLFDQAPGFVAVLKGSEHRFELANRAFYQLVGRSDLIGKSVREALPEVVDQGFVELLDKVFGNGEPFIGYNVEVTVQPEADSTPVTRWLNFIYQPVVGADGTVTSIFVQGNDVTTQKLAQDEVKRYQNELENLVNERTQALEETRAALLHAQKLESIGKLTGGIAHDFNNVLQIVSGNLQLLQAHIGNNQLAANRLETAAAAVDRGAKLSSQLLSFARRQPLEPAVLNLARIVRGMDGMLRQALGEAVEVETVVAGGMWNTQLDPHQLENAILNLAINARDAMDARGKLTIEVGNSMLDDEYVRAHPYLAAGQYVMLAVSDTGTGMTPRVMERAFEPFFTTKPDGVGTGLGLSMVYGFVKQSDGHIRIYSELGHGTTIRMYFPRSFEAETEVVPYSCGPVTGGTETILVVEDDSSVQTTVVAMLTALGYRVLKANNADSALIILKSGVPIDLLFTDVVMPGELRAPELARQAKLLIPGIEVLFTSGYTQNAIVHGGRLDRGVHLLSKPYRREQLALKVRQLFANREQAALAKQPMASAVDSAPNSQTARRRILVVEDNVDSQELACEMLAVLGHEAKGVATAEEAINLLAGEQIDVLFTDVSLPGMSGVELAKHAKQTRPALKVIFASGYGEVTGNMPEFQSIILPKPYDLAKLEEALEQVK
jgi:PAS domain S-box-containing protein